MVKAQEPTAIKKYANRRLYNTGTSSYVTLEDLGEMVKAGEDFVVNDARTNEDITRSVLAQMIFDQENKGQNLLPITFLRQLIRFYGDSIQVLVPSFLEFSIAGLVREQQNLRDQMAEGWAKAPWSGAGFTSLEENARQNTALFERAFRLFSPFGIEESNAVNSTSNSKPEMLPSANASEISEIKKELAEMKDRLDKIISMKN